MKNRTTDYYRYQRQMHIRRKKRISKDYWHVKYDGQLSKGKIHCSCWMCRPSGKATSVMRKEVGLKEREDNYYNGNDDCF